MTVLLRISLLAVCASFSHVLGACGTCDSGNFTSFGVTVRDAQTDATICDADVSVRRAGSATWKAAGDSGTCVYTDADGAGTFDVLVAAMGYATREVDSISVGVDRCGSPQPQSVVVRLDRAP